jgi:hypothetical protein
MKQIKSLTADFFIHNSAGWMLISANFAMILFFHNLSSGLIHTRLPSSGTSQKITVVSSFNPTGNALADMAMLMTIFLNSPAFYISNLFYQTFFLDPTENLSTIDRSCTFCWFYISQIGCDVFFIILQWLVIGLIIKRLCKLVKDS